MRNSSSFNADMKTASRIGIISIIINTLLAGIKFWAASVSGSIAITADAWHTLSDSFTSLVLVIGCRFASRPADEKHPFGHGRAEIITSVIIGVLLGIVSFHFLIQSFLRLNSHKHALYGMLSIIAISLSLIIKEGMAWYSIRVGKQRNSQSLIADGWHHQSDAASSLLVLFGIAFNNTFWWIDGVLGIIVALCIAYTSYQILAKSTSSLIGEEPDNTMIELLNETIHRICSHPTRIHHIHVHTYGPHQEITFHLTLPSHMTIQEAHSIADRIESILQQQYSIEATIHIEPEKK